MLAGALWSFASSAVVTLLDRRDQQVAERKAALRSAMRQRLRDNEAVEQLADAEVMQAAAGLAGRPDAVEALRSDLLSDPVFTRALARAGWNYALDPEAARGDVRTALEVANKYVANRPELEWEGQFTPLLERLMGNVLERIREEFGDRLTAAEHRRQLERLDEIADLAGPLAAELTRRPRNYLTLEQWCADRRRKDRLLYRDEEMERFEPRHLHPCELDADEPREEKQPADDVFRQFLGSDESALLLVGPPGVGKSQLLVHWYRLAEEEGAAPRFVAAFEADRVADWPECDHLVVFVDEVERLEAAERTVTRLLQAAYNPCAYPVRPERVQVVLTAWSRLRGDLLEACSGGMERWNLMDKLEPEDGDFADFLRRRFPEELEGVPEAEVNRIAGVCDGYPGVAWEFVRLPRDKWSGVSKREDIYQRVIEDFLARVRERTSQERLAEKLLDALVVMDGYHEGLAGSVAEVLEENELDLGGAWRDVLAVGRNDLLIPDLRGGEDGGVTWWTVRPDLRRINWLGRRLLRDSRALDHYVRGLLPLNPYGVITGLLGLLGEEREATDDALSVIRDVLVPAVTERLCAADALWAFGRVYQELPEALLPLEAADLDALEAARNRCVEEAGEDEGAGAPIAAAASALLAHDRPRDALEWFAAASAVGIAPLREHVAAYNWGSALSHAALLERDEDRPEQARELFEESFARYRRALKIKEDYHEAAYNWGNALSDAALLERDEDRPEQARALFEESFEKYRRALKIKEDKHEAANNWGSALSDAALLEGDEDRPEQARALFEESFARYRQALDIKGDYHEAANNWGIALSDAARLERDEDRPEQARELFEESFEKYRRALKIKEDYHEAAYNWGSALSDAARLERDEDRPEQARELFEESFARYRRALEIKGDFHEAANNWGNALSHAALLERDEDRPEQARELFEESFARYRRALKIKQDFGEAAHNAVVAHRDLAEGLTGADRAEAVRDACAMALVLGTILLGRGDGPGAAEAVGWAQGYAAENSVPEARADALGTYLLFAHLAGASEEDLHDGLEALREHGTQTELSAFCRAVVEDGSLPELDLEPLHHRYLHAVARAYLRGRDDEPDLS